MKEWTAFTGGDKMGAVFGQQRFTEFHKKGPEDLLSI
jgi:hypothetical protein